MAYDYGVSKLAISNPFRLAGTLEAARGAIVAALGVVLIFILRGTPMAAGSLIGTVKLVGALGLLGGGIAAIAAGMLRVFRFYVGREIPADLADTGNRRHATAKKYSQKAVKEMLMSRTNPTFVEPTRWLSRLFHSIEGNLLFLPPPLRQITQSLLDTGAYVIATVTLYGLALLAGSTGLVPIGDTPVPRWLGWIFVVALIWIWWRNRPALRRLASPWLLDSNRILVGVIAAAILLPTVLYGVHRSRGLPEIPLSPNPWLLLLAVGGIAVCGSALLMSFHRMPRESPNTAVSEYRDQWQESVHPMDIFRAFDMTMADFRFQEVPNRIYEQHNPALVEDVKGIFSGSMIQETQPIPVTSADSHELTALRVWNLIAGNLLLLGSAACTFVLVVQLGDIGLVGRVRWLMWASILGVFGMVLTRAAVAFLGEIRFESRLVHFFINSGTFARSKLSTGMAIHDSTRSENEVVRSSLTPWVLCSRLESSTIATSGAQNLEQSRFVLAMHKDDAFLAEVVRALQHFVRSRQLLAGLTSNDDFRAAGTLHVMNQAQGRTGPTPELPAERLPPVLLRPGESE